MPYALNPLKQANFTHPDIGIIPPLTAVKIDDVIVDKVKGYNNIVIFDDVVEISEPPEEMLTYDDFVRKYNGDLIKASREWDKYKEKKDEMAGSSEESNTNVSDIVQEEKPKQDSVD